MRIIEHGLVGMYVQCPTCASVFQLETTDEVEQMRGLRYSLITNFCVLCQECKSNIVVLRKKLVHGPSPGSWHTDVERLNFISPTAASRIC